MGFCPALHGTYYLEGLLKAQKAVGAFNECGLSSRQAGERVHELVEFRFFTTFIQFFNLPDIPMVQVHSQFITDTVGKKLVVLPLDEFDAMIEELEDIEDIRLFDEAKREDDGSRVSLGDYMKQRKAK